MTICRPLLSEVVIERRAECFRELLGARYHFIKGIVALLDKHIVLLHLAILSVNIELDALLFALELHDLLLQLTALHPLLHHLIVDLVPAKAQLLHLSLQLVKVVELCHFLPLLSGFFCLRFILIAWSQLQIILFKLLNQFSASN